MDFNFDHLRSFICVARLGSLTTAAKQLKVTQPNLGRQMIALSKEVGIDLFVRHARGMRLTKQGEDFFELCCDIVGRLAQGTDAIKGKHHDPSGCLKVISGSGMQERILQKLPVCSKKFPDINIAFPSVRDMDQLQIGDADVALTIESPNATDLIQLPLYSMILRIYASPVYLKLHGIPKALEDLKAHKIIIYGGENSELFNSQLPNEIIKNLGKFIMVTDGPSMRTALINGLGIGCFGYNKIIMEKNLLVDVFPDMPDKIIPYYFTYHCRLKSSPKIKALYGFLKEEVVPIWQRSDQKSFKQTPLPLYHRDRRLQQGRQGIQDFSSNDRTFTLSPNL